MHGAARSLRESTGSFSVTRPITDPYLHLAQMNTLNGPLVQAPRAAEFPTGQTSGGRGVLHNIPTGAERATSGPGCSRAARHAPMASERPARPCKRSRALARFCAARSACPCPWRRGVSVESVRRRRPGERSLMAGAAGAGQLPAATGSAGYRQRGLPCGAT